MFLRSLFVLLAVFTCWCAGNLNAQTAVYRLTFEPTGDSINYRPYQNGYYIAPIDGGSGSLVLTVITGNVKQYFAYEAFGEVFVAVNGDNKKMVLSATAANDVSTTVFYAIGKADKEIEVETRNAVSKIKLATRLMGYAVSADSEQDLPFYGSGTSVGVAGASILTARLDETLTNQAIQNNASVDTQVDNVIAILAGSGYVDGKATTPGTGTTTGGGTNGAGTGEAE